MIVFTKAGDTPESITCEYLGQSNAEFAKQVQEANLNTTAWHMMGGSGCYSHNRAIWLPLDEGAVHLATREYITRSFDYMTGQQREAAAKAQRAGIDHQTLVGAHKLTLYANQTLAEKEDSNSGYFKLPPVVGASLTVAAGTTDNALDFKHEQLKEFKAHLNDVKTSLQDLAKAKPKTSELKAAEQQYLHSRRELNKHFKRLLKQRKLYNHPLLRTGSVAAVKAQANKMQRTGWAIYDEQVMHGVSRATTALKWSGWGFGIADVAEDVFKVADSYLKGKNWKRELTKDGIEFALDFKAVPSATVKLLKYASSFVPEDVMIGLEAAGIIAIDLTPIGWVGMVILGAAQVAGTMAFDKFVDWRFDS